MNLKDFDPNGPSLNPNNLFGLPHGPEEAKLVIIPVPWEVTTSGRSGTANGPKRVLAGSHQVDLFNRENLDAWKEGIAFDVFPTQLISLQTQALKGIGNYREFLTSNKACLSGMQGAKDNPQTAVFAKAINECCEQVNFWVKRRATEWLEQDKIVATLGGDHSTCYGLVHALTERYKDISVLQIDAHADLRAAYEGLTYSHASIMYNIMKLPNLSSITAVGVRDLCQEEYEFIESQSNVICHYDRQIKENLHSGIGWSSIVETIVEGLGQNVYLSFDVDGLNPSLCPNTGTPVPGGLEFEEAMTLIQAVVKSGRTIIGFDISECGDAEWDGNVAARLLWRIFSALG